MALPQDDIELLTQFKNDATKELAFTAILKKYQEKLLILPEKQFLMLKFLPIKKKLCSLLPQKQMRWVIIL